MIPAIQRESAERPVKNPPIVYRDDMSRRAEIGPKEAAEAMAAIDNSRSWLANRAVAPCWYHPVLGVLAGALIAVGEAHNWLLFYCAVAGCSVGCGALMWLKQRRVGQVLALGVLVGLACWLDLGQGMRGAFLVAAVLAVPITVIFGRWTDTALRADLGAG